LFGFGPNALLALFALITLLSGFVLLWRVGETPILPFIFGFQWLQTSLGIFYGNWRDVNVDRLSPVSGNIELAIVLCLIGLLFLAVGMRLGMGRPYVAEVELARRTAQEQSQIKLFVMYVVAIGIAITSQLLAGAIPGLSQPLLVLASFKWAAFFMLTFATFSRPDTSRALWGVAFLTELLMSLGGYFSSFKFVLLFTLLALISAHIKLTVRKAIFGGFFAVVIIIVGVVWTAVKVEYRSFLSGGEASQLVVVDYQQSVDKLIDLISALDAEELNQATNEFITRIIYVDYFGAILNYVPNIVPHEEGGRWFDAITRPFMPRLFFPDKAVIDDSEATAKYTGLDIAGQQEGTTVSIGYMGDSYIDFGAFGMMAPIFGLGLLLGFIYRWLMLHPNSHGVLGMALSTALLLTTSSYLENSAASMFGAIIVSVLVNWFLITYAARPFLSFVHK
jgi:hypothetical protein